MRILIILVVAGAFVMSLTSGRSVRSPVAAAPIDAVERGPAVSSAMATGTAAPIVAPGETVLMREGNGHFFAQADVNYGQVRFLVDTGASGIALSENDARRIGIAIDPASYIPIGQGASGAVMGQSIRLQSVSVDGKRVENVPAVVIQGGDTSLLGQSFLARLESVRIEGDRMILR